MTESTENQKLEIKVDLNVLKHLGVGLYSSTPAVITEIIANAWDADADEATISIDTEGGCIEITDDGHGMSHADIQNKFLVVGYARRAGGINKSQSGKRRVMGRKGIGKLAMFSLARKIEIASKAENEDPVAARIDVDALLSCIEKNEAYELEAIPYDDSIKSATGTRIVLSDLTSKIHKTAAYLRPRLARRFGIIGPEHGFSLVLDGSPITKKDREFYDDIELLWGFDETTELEVKGLANNIAALDDGTNCIARLDNQLVVDGVTLTVSGFIATVDKPKKLLKADENINQLSIFANGRVFQEDVLADLGNSKVFNNYIIGEVNADFLDADEIDRATSSREAIKLDDPYVQALREKLQSDLSEIADQWDEWRRELGYSKKPEALPAIKKWIEGLEDKRDRSLAERLMVSINNITLSNSEKENDIQKLQLFRSTIVGFEKLRARKQLDRLEAVTDVLSPQFQEIFTTLDDIEETYYHDITKGRLAVIERFEEIVDDKELEKVAQKYLYKHLWLLDPTWGRVASNLEMEKTLTEELLKINPLADSGARLDIAYRTGSGRHAIIELKKPGLTSIDFFALIKQGKKYQEAVLEYLKSHPDIDGFKGRFPPIDLFFLLEKGFGEDESQSKMLDAINARILTYKGLIVNARNSYEEYLAANEAVSRIETVLADLDQSSNS